ncbi:TPA: hypothetical protein ACKTCD_001036 [Streptococcus pyogenes]
MKFICKRTSDYDERPCEEAVKESITFVDHRNVRTFEDLKRACGEDFLARGTNHKETSTGIQRDLGPRDVYMIEVNTLEELLEFREKYKRIVIKPYYDNHDYLLIEIYDTWRE